MKRTALKKAVGLLVSTAMIVSMAGCGSKDSGSLSADSAQESAPAQAESESSAEEDADSQTEPGSGEQITITL